MSKHHIDPSSENIDEMKQASREWTKLFDKIRELNRKNSLVLSKFGGDIKASRVYTTLDGPSEKRPHFNQPLSDLIKSAKTKIDEQITKNKNLLDNTGYVNQTIKQVVLESFDSSDKTLSANILEKVSTLMTDEYIKEYRGEE